MGLLVLAVCAIVAGILMHWLLREKYILASILSGPLAAWLFNVVHDVVLGFPDKWIGIAVLPEILLSIVVAALVGYVYWLRRDASQQPGEPPLRS